MAVNKVEFAGNTLIDLTDTTAVAADVASGKLFHLASGVLATGTAVMSGGLDYEIGTFEPEENVARPQINFAKTHATMPILVSFSDATGVDTTTQSNLVFTYFDYWKAFGKGFPYNTTNVRYSIIWYNYRLNNTGSTSVGATTTSYTSGNVNKDETKYPRYWVDESGFRPYTTSSSRYWRAGRTYKWIAVWYERT